VVWLLLSLPQAARSVAATVVVMTARQVPFEMHGHLREPGTRFPQVLTTTRTTALLATTVASSSGNPAHLADTVEMRGPLGQHQAVGHGADRH
jgi:hypothetical protein